MTALVAAGFLSVFMGVISPLIASPDGDYQTRPPMEVRYDEVDAHLIFSSNDTAIEGRVTYRFSPKHEYVSELQWYAPGITITGFSSNHDQVSHQTEGDSIRVTFEDFLEKDQTTSVTLEYDAHPSFGVHLKHSGTIFSSNLPGSVAHWLPGPIHPRVSSPVKIVMDVPDGMTAVAPGELESEETLETGKRFTWNYHNPVPLSELSFAVGDFEMEEAFYGIKNLRIYHETDAISDQERRELFDFMVRKIRDLERQMRSEIPVPSIQVVVFEDDRWETRPYAAGTVFIYQSLGDMLVQLERSIAAQWFGVSVRPEQWQQYDYPALLQALVAEQAGHGSWEESNDPLHQAFEVPETIYQKAGMDYWQWARHYVEKVSERQQEASIITRSFSEAFRDFAGQSGIYSEEDFSRFLYDDTGLYFEAPEFQKPDPEPVFRYRVEVSEVSGSDRYALTFEPLGDIADQEFPVMVKWTREGSLQHEEYSFHGHGDRIEITPGGRIQDLRLEESVDENVAFEVDKPFSLLFYQLRTSEEPEQRQRAALALKEHADDPDLQLAVQDMIQREESPKVLGALYDLMASITAGASGTDRLFLEGLSSEYEEVRNVSIKALRAYSDVSRVEEEVLSVIQVSDDIGFVNDAITTYRHLIEEGRFRDFALQFIREDRQDLLFTKTLLMELFNVPITEETVDATLIYLYELFPFELRWEVYRLLRQNDTGIDWETEFLDRCYDDPDPRIRFLTLFSLSNYDQSERITFLESRMSQEYDIRILKRVQELADSE